MLLFASLAKPAWGYVGSLEILPLEPTPQDDIAVLVSGDLPTPCWSIRGHLVVLDGDRIHVDVLMEEQPVPCIQIIVPYTVQVPLGRLEEGPYVLTVRDAQDEESIVFEVGAGPPPVPEPRFLRGDANADRSVDISDAIGIIMLLFLGGRPSMCLDAMDANDDGKVDISDPILLLHFLFRGDGDVPPPFAECGADPTEDGLSCGEFEPCRPGGAG